MAYVDSWTHTTQKQGNWPGVSGQFLQRVNPDQKPGVMRRFSLKVVCDVVD